MACRAMKISMLLSTLLLTAVASEKATAAVSETHENAFTIETTVMVDATPASTWRDLARVESVVGSRHTPGRARPGI